MGYATRSFRAHVFRLVRQFPSDLLVVAGFVAVANALLLIEGLRDVTALGLRVRPLIVAPLLLFVPGYVLVAIAFPGRAERNANQGWLRAGAPTSVDLVERTALSFGLSVAVLPVFGLVLALTTGFALLPGLELFSGLVALGIVVGAIRRLRLPPEARFRVPAGQWLRAIRSRIVGADSRIDASLNLLLVVAVLATVATAAFTVGAPAHGNGFSTIYLATQDPDGSAVASGYPTDFTAGDGRPLTVAVENHEGTTTSYTVAIELERVRTGDGAATVAERQSIGRLDARVAPGETWTRRHLVAPSLVGEDLRLHYYLYRDANPPEAPSADDAYRDVYIWIDVAPR